jgi:hypothetical protein
MEVLLTTNLVAVVVAVVAEPIAMTQKDIE